jgi:hypothetical protein
MTARISGKTEGMVVDNIYSDERVGEAMRLDKIVWIDISCLRRRRVTE